ncbi:DUF4920 domain-containing protein [Changchengzhania lutea]|uniref:DUF4920 domain-containing protein n=1 Tax=Changchengzhania lutea TaxID=2049305 RepID=UPI00115E9F67|nr:DUF4920 domain-containing protein [Changchengzhania lutea]
MKNVLVVLTCFLLLNACKDKTKDETPTEIEVAKVEYQAYGNEIIPDDAIEAASMATHYKTMAVGDSINSKIRAKVKEVCQAKGCWMTLDLEEGDEVMVKFKDYGFFVPKDIAGKDIIINGKAYVKEVSVDEQRHYAEDAGKGSEEIAAITLPKKTYSFEADGVLIKQ